MTKSERDHISRAVALGCALCRHLGLGETPSEYHHQRTGTGAGRKADHMRGMPLCPQHHRLGNEAFHVLGRRAWEDHHGVTETVLVDWTNEILYPNGGNYDNDAEFENCFTFAVGIASMGIHALGMLEFVAENF